MKYITFIIAFTLICLFVFPVFAQDSERECIEGDCQDGTGTMTYPYGPTGEGEGLYIYHGEFKNGREHGHGRYTLPTGYTFEGEFKNGKRSGYGVGTYSDGRVMKGIWKNDRYVGSE